MESTLVLPWTGATRSTLPLPSAPGMVPASPSSILPPDDEPVILHPVGGMP